MPDSPFTPAPYHIHPIPNKWQTISLSLSIAATCIYTTGVIILLSTSPFFPSPSSPSSSSSSFFSYDENNTTHPPWLTAAVFISSSSICTILSLLLALISPIYTLHRRCRASFGDKGDEMGFQLCHGHCSNLSGMTGSDSTAAPHVHRIADNSGVFVNQTVSLLRPLSHDFTNPLACLYLSGGDDGTVTETDRVGVRDFVVARLGRPHYPTAQMQREEKDERDDGVEREGKVGIPCQDPEIMTLLPPQLPLSTEMLRRHGKEERDDDNLNDDDDDDDNAYADDEQEEDEEDAAAGLGSICAECGIWVQTPFCSGCGTLIVNV